MTSEGGVLAQTQTAQPWDIVPGASWTQPQTFYDFLPLNDGNSALSISTCLSRRKRWEGRDRGRGNPPNVFLGWARGFQPPPITFTRWNSTMTPTTSQEMMDVDSPDQEVRLSLPLFASWFSRDVFWLFDSSSFLLLACVSENFNIDIHLGISTRKTCPNRSMHLHSISRLPPCVNTSSTARLNREATEDHRECQESAKRC